jgi:tRNA threonylcarbamoyladenosine biosynthesis protein TsaB
LRPVKEPLILHIETATDICSVALSAGEEMLSLEESGPERNHATLLNRFIRLAFSTAGRTPGEIDAVSVSKGPGSYTGLRIGVSTAKGIAYALRRPLIASGTLLNMAFGALRHQEVQNLQEEYGEKLLLCPMIDARRMEVYAGFYTTGLNEYRKVSADIIESSSYSEILDTYRVCFFGNGAEKSRKVLDHPHAYFPTGISPSAAYMIQPAIDRFYRNQFENVAYFEPFYLKDFVATRPGKKLL